MTAADWNYANIWEAIARADPAALALIHRDRVWNWGEFDAQADTLARYLTAAGVPAQGRIAFYLPNVPAYAIGTYAAFKGAFVPFNVNYRYAAGEVAYLLDNADAEAVLFAPEFTEVAAECREKMPAIRNWVCAGDAADCPDWATPLEAILNAPAVDIALHHRSGEDLLFVYTGGTTGHPKAVMWRQQDLIGVGNYCANVALGLPPLASPDEAGARAIASGRPITIPACPLMHATGLMGAIGAWCAGGAVAFLPSSRFDVVELLDLAERTGAARISIVGDAFARPILEKLDAYPRRWNLSRLRNIISSGAIWSHDVKQALFRHLPDAVFSDSFGSSEAFGVAISHATRDAPAHTAEFVRNPNCTVFDEDGVPVVPGSGQRGLIAVRGHMPLGYHKDPARSAAAFPTIAGERWSVPGDWAEVTADGAIRLLGRGSQCINTGGEKVFPEEVEEALKRHPGVRDAAVVGLPDRRFGERICALVERVPGASLSLAELADHIRLGLAAFKVPRDLLFFDSLNRGDNGKLDYPALRRRALDLLGENV